MAAKSIKISFKSLITIGENKEGEIPSMLKIDIPIKRLVQRRPRRIGARHH